MLFLETEYLLLGHGREGPGGKGGWTWQSLWNTAVCRPYRHGNPRVTREASRVQSGGTSSPKVNKTASHSSPSPATSCQEKQPPLPALWLHPFLQEWTKTPNHATVRSHCWTDQPSSPEPPGLLPPPHCQIHFELLAPQGCVCRFAKSLQSCPTLCDPMDCSPSVSSVHEILQARILGWVVMPFSRGSSQPKDQTHAPCVASIGRQVLYH